MARRIVATGLAACAIAMVVVGQSAVVAAQRARATATQSVTFTGCLRADGSKFVLTDLKGNQAPRGRSWKTAFIKKTAKDVEVVSVVNTVRLKDHVGRQVTVVGVRDDATHVKAKSIKRAAASCS